MRNMLNSPLLAAIGRGLVAGIVPAALIEAAISYGGGSANIVVVILALVLGGAAAVVRPALGLEYDRTLARGVGLVSYVVVIAGLQLLLPSSVAFIAALAILAGAFIVARLFAPKRASGRDGSAAKAPKR
jgi:hypothetical protein